MLVVGGQKQRRSAEQRDRIRRMNAAETIEVPLFTPAPEAGLARICVSLRSCTPIRATASHYTRHADGPDGAVGGGM